MHCAAFKAPFAREEHQDRSSSCSVLILPSYQTAQIEDIF